MGGSDKDEEEDGKMEERKLKTSFLWYGKREPTCRAIDSAMLSGGRRIPLLSPPPLFVESLSISIYPPSALV